MDWVAVLGWGYNFRLGSFPLPPADEEEEKCKEKQNKYYVRISGGLQGYERVFYVPIRPTTTPTRVPANGCEVKPLEIPCAAPAPVGLALEELEAAPAFPLPCCVAVMLGGVVETEVRSVVLIAVDF